MNERITVSGIIGTDPHKSVTSKLEPITSFRLAASQSHFDRAKNAWVDEDTSWFSVRTFRLLASNAAQSLHKGEHVVVTGRVKVRNWNNADRSGTNVEIDADAVGHDLSWYTTVPVRSGPPSQVAADRTRLQSVEASADPARGPPAQPRGVRNIPRYPTKRRTPAA